MHWWQNAQHFSAMASPITSEVIHRIALFFKVWEFSSFHEFLYDLKWITQESFFLKIKRKWPCYEKILIVNFRYSVCRRGIFNCTSYPCPAVCTIYGDRHYYTFDGLEYDYVSDCQAYLLKVGGFFIHFHVSKWKFLWEGKYFEYRETICRNKH